MPPILILEYQYNNILIVKVRFMQRPKTKMCRGFGKQNKSRFPRGGEVTGTGN